MILKNHCDQEKAQTFYTTGSEERFQDVYFVKFRSILSYWNGVKWEFNFLKGENVSNVSCHSSVEYILNWLISANIQPDYLCNFACAFLHHPICIKKDQLNHSMDIIIV